LQESRILGLPSGITQSDVKKFNELLEKHGDASQNKQYMENIQKKIDKKAEKI
jgi:hypothetical protein